MLFRRTLNVILVVVVGSFDNICWLFLLDYMHSSIAGKLMIFPGKFKLVSDEENHSILEENRINWSKIFPTVLGHAKIQKHWHLSHQLVPLQRQLVPLQHQLVPLQHQLLPLQHQQGFPCCLIFARQKGEEMIQQKL